MTAMGVNCVLILREKGWGNLILTSGGRPRCKFYVNIERNIWG